MARVEVKASEGSGEGGTFDLGAEPFQVGTSRRCQLQLKEHGISFVHAIIAPEADGWAITAKPSSAGTTVNGEPVKSGTTRRLAAGDRLLFGKVEARFVDAGPPAAPAAPGAASPAVAAPPKATTTRLAAAAAAPAKPAPERHDAPFHVPARMEAPPAARPAPSPIAVDAGTEALLRRLEGAEGERDHLRSLVTEAQADADDARRALAALEARQEALQAERDGLRREVARLEAELRLARARQTT